MRRSVSSIQFSTRLSVFVPQVVYFTHARSNAMSSRLYDPFRQCVKTGTADYVRFRTDTKVSWTSVRRVAHVCCIDYYERLSRDEGRNLPPFRCAFRIGIGGMAQLYMWQSWSLAYRLCRCDAYPTEPVLSSRKSVFDALHVLRSFAG